MLHELMMMMETLDDEPCLAVTGDKGQPHGLKPQDLAKALQIGARMSPPNMGMRLLENVGGMPAMAEVGKLMNGKPFSQAIINKAAMKGADAFGTQGFGRLADLAPNMPAQPVEPTNLLPKPIAPIFEKH